MGDIAYQNKDIASKLTGETLVGKNLAVFGLPHLSITGILPTNLPAIESNELRIDNLFQLEDGSLAIMDYESKFVRENFIKYLNYIARVLKRYAGQDRLHEVWKIKMLVLYTADVERAEEVYDLGGLTLQVESAYLVRQDTEEIYRRLDEKLLVGARLDEEDLMQLMILPLTVKGRQDKQVMIERSVELARRIPERDQTLRALAGILTFSDKVIDEAYKNRIKEEMRMTQIGQMIFEDGVIAGKAEGEAIGKEIGKKIGKELGKELGKEIGEENFAALTERLIEDSRMEDLAKAARDKNYRAVLFREYGIKA
ncbi:hypothetical protein [Clostridium sp. AN503]|uniref:hypothetical protein n=1 Tax=Clostridium sp. AN503 TaxID=3160598 RepID=UPI00345AB476